MRVRMKTLSAGPAGVLAVGEVYDLPEAQARELVAGNYAEPVDRPAVPAKETAAVKGAKETAARTGRSPRAPQGDPPDVRQ